ncbi:carboxymuconolactone decarboxylase family protein [Microbacterium sp. zg.Y1090]|uniref:carboxymuconolactone decarboxylase family protein n=1 Tax=Microbacterium TaxID=33882 RepID=UPI00214ADAD8|nr:MULTISPECIES: carboxymuconolactone decarboxylase family protein [unclassified Microbacterium]MCR2813514.1 carboxymuconolactone decarboxylase family protein [Microbacterium sp. zg.Y1084]MCR2818149.1 carboxymuconolactone decarboxylase family protein [Microbacterium sp. zg.Y1090]MDL5486671.1 carboxymuconolactone decarboxylase family protein [Microbacterium sp. zg-Y1211]WIM27698.1 carboxymuconolactone decarboxylase family protein [Microbacterium sp. zg-Y1090]
MTDQPRVHLSRSARGAYRALEGLAKTVGSLADDAGIDARLRELVQIHASQLNGCAYCVRVHVDRAVAAGMDVDLVAQLPVWRDSGVFTERERAALELTEAHVYIHEEGVSDEVYDHVGGILSEQEYVALSWILVSINAFNRVAIAGRYPVEPRAGENA